MAGRPKKDRSNWKCKNCGSDKYWHYRDYCHKCYTKKRLKERTEKDPLFMEKEKERARRVALNWYRRKNKEDPTWNSKKQKKFRTAHPAAFNFCMCKCYYRKLSLENRERLAKEVTEEERCVMCGDTGFFKIGSGKTATLNGKDCTELIEAHYKKGQWLCEDCLFK